MLERRFAERETNFVSMIRREVYGRPSNPYHNLLRAAGCEVGDVEALVRQRGLEAALTVLFSHGVYLAVDEFKGRRPVVRGATTIEIRPADLRNHGAAQHIPLQSGGSRGTRWGERLVRAGALAVGAALPRLQYVPLDDPLPIVHWMVAALRAGRHANLWTYASSAVRLCQAATEAGLDLRGAQFSVGEEPFTEARRATIRGVGAEEYRQYGIAECGEVGFGCLAPSGLDEIHVLHDLHALTQAGADGPARGQPPDALLISSLHPRAAFVLLNVSMGDRGTLGERACGCPMAKLGWTTHIRALRSGEKLTAAG